MAVHVPVHPSWTWAASTVHLIPLRSDDNTNDFVFLLKIFFRCILGSLLFYSWPRPLRNSGQLYPKISYWAPFLLLLRYFWITSVMSQTETLAFCITVFCIISATSRSSDMVSQFSSVLTILSNHFSLANLIEMLRSPKTNHVGNEWLSTHLSDT